MKVAATTTVGLLVAIGGVVGMTGAFDGSKRPEFGLTPEGDEPVPRFVAVSDGGRGIAGYVERALLDGTATMPASPKDALARYRDEKGEVYRVFNTEAEVVGYWATGKGFVNETRKDELTSEGWRYFAGSEPEPR